MGEGPGEGFDGRCRGKVQGEGAGEGAGGRCRGKVQGEDSGGGALQGLTGLAVYAG